MTVKNEEMTLKSSTGMTKHRVIVGHRPFLSSSGSIFRVIIGLDPIISEVDSLVKQGNDINITPGNDT